MGIFSGIGFVLGGPVGMAVGQMMDNQRDDDDHNGEKEQPAKESDPPECRERKTAYCPKCGKALSRCHCPQEDNLRNK